MSARQTPESELPEAAEALLREWPAPARSALAWEQSADAVMERVRETTIGSTSSDLLDAPLPTTEGADAGAVASEPMDAEEPGLASIARAAVAGGAPTVSREIARDLMLAAEQSRQAQPSRWVVAAAPRGTDPHHPPVSELKAPAPGRLRKAAPPAREAAAAYSEMPPSSQSESRKPGFAAGMFGGAALAFAAAAALYLTVRGHEGVPALAPASTETAVLAASSAPKAPAPTPAPAEAEPQPVRTLEELPSEPAASAATGSRGAAPAATSAAATPSPASKGALSFHVERPSKDRLTLEERPDDAAMEESPQQNAAPASPKGHIEPGAPAKVAKVIEAVPSAPSLGAIQGAVGSVMGGARSCLAGQDEGSKVSLTFGSDGRVQSVSISGPAAGTPAEGCLRSALMAARVPAFSDPSYSAALTVRPP